MNESPMQNIKDVEFVIWGNGGRFAARLLAIAPRLGARKQDYRLEAIPPGKTCWPYYCFPQAANLK